MYYKFYDKETLQLESGYSRITGDKQFPYCIITNYAILQDNAILNIEDRSIHWFDDEKVMTETLSEDAIITGEL